MSDTVRMLARCPGCALTVEWHGVASKQGGTEWAITAHRCIPALVSAAAGSPVVSGQDR